MQPFVGRVKGTILDIGCGNGKLKGFLSSDLNYTNVDLTNTVIGVDPATPNVETRFPVIRGVGEALPIKSRSVGAVVICSALDHTTDCERVLTEAKRVLKSKCPFFIWNTVWLREGMVDKRHTYSWTDPELLRLISGYFQISEILRYQNWWTMPVLFIKAIKVE